MPRFLQFQKRIILLLIIFLLFCQITDIYGDTLMREKLRNMWQDTWIKAGPFRIKAVMFLNDVGYDSNVYRTNTNPIKDFRITAGPGITVFLPVKKRILFSIYGSPQYVFFKDTERERAWNSYFNGGVHFFINRFLLAIYSFIAFMLGLPKGRILSFEPFPNTLTVFSSRSIS